MLVGNTHNKAARSDVHYAAQLGRYTKKRIHKVKGI